MRCKVHGGWLKKYSSNNMLLIEQLFQFTGDMKSLENLKTSPLPCMNDFMHWLYKFKAASSDFIFCSFRLSKK